MREVVRNEKKYLLTKAEAFDLRGRAEKFLTQDAHSKDGGYLVRSLYFDTILDTDLSEKFDGVEVRRKIRLRTYSPDARSAFLEMKQKQGAYQRKRSIELKRDDAIRLMNLDYSVLLEYDTDLAKEFYVLMQTRFYRPKVVIDYKRSAFVGKENDTRITFDYDISASRTNFDIFDAGLNTVPVIDPSMVVLEVKYNRFLVSYIKNFISGVDKSEISVSKYVMGRANL